MPVGSSQSIAEVVGLQRLLLLSRAVSSDVPVKKVFRDIRLASVFWGISAAILLAAIVVATWKFSSL